MKGGGKWNTGWMPQLTAEANQVEEQPTVLHVITTNHLLYHTQRMQPPYSHNYPSFLTSGCVASKHLGREGILPSYSGQTRNSRQRIVISAVRSNPTPDLITTAT